MDSPSVEIEIQRLLDREYSPARVVELLMERIASSDTNDADRFGYWFFLYNSGNFQEVLESMCKRIDEKKRIHWGLLIETLGRFNVQPKKAVHESIFKGLKRQNAVEDISASRSWDAFDARYGELRQAVIAERLKAPLQRKESLLEKFNFLKSQRMIDQAGRVLKKLMFLYPEEKSFSEIQTSFDEENARELLSQRYAEADMAGRTPRTEIPVATQMLLAYWLTAAKSLAKGAPESTYDFAVMFNFVDGLEASLDLAQAAAGKTFSPDTSRGPDWLVAELMLKLRRYVDLLEHLRTLEVQYAQDPETAFAVNYLRAQAMHALGQSAQAVEILRNIVQIRPDYRSAVQLIHEWSVGVTTA